MMSVFKEFGCWTSLKSRRSCCLFLQVFLLTSVVFVVLDRLTEELWQERANAAVNLFRPPTRKEELPNATIWDRIKNAKEILKCSSKTACSATPFKDIPVSNAETCPFYFSWIKKDLSPWAARGISRELVERGKKFANFRVIIVDGRLFVECYRKSFQTRDLFTIWGLAQLLKFYPGMVPDVDLIFNADDRPMVFRRLFNETVAPPPLFRYCGSANTFDIPFPDWSFWGWPEVEIPPWEAQSKQIAEANAKLKWKYREPIAYWRGNPKVCQKRRALLKCKKRPNWKGQLFIQNWQAEKKVGFQNSRLSKQCRHRYKIYVDGTAWSVSLKYILACDSTTLLVDTPFIDFFIRGLMPFRDYWPIRTSHMCTDIDFAVDWGNKNPQKAEKIGKLGTEFVFKQMEMPKVYAYMLHLLNEYSKLMTYTPTVTDRGAEYCSETIPCFATEAEKEYMYASAVSVASPAPPCLLPTANDSSISEFLGKKQKALDVLNSLKL